MPSFTDLFTTAVNNFVGDTKNNTKATMSLRIPARTCWEHVKNITSATRRDKIQKRITSIKGIPSATAVAALLEQLIADAPTAAPDDLIIYIEMPKAKKQDAFDAIQRNDFIGLINCFAQFTLRSKNGSTYSPLGGIGDIKQQLRDILFLLVVEAVGNETPMQVTRTYTKDVNPATVGARSDVFAKGFVSDHFAKDLAEARSIAQARSAAGVLISHTFDLNHADTTAFCTNYPAFRDEIIRPLFSQLANVGSGLLGKGRVVEDVFFCAKPMTGWEIETTSKTDSTIKRETVFTSPFYFAVLRKIPMTVASDDFLVYHFECRRPQKLDLSYDSIDLSNSKYNKKNNIKHPYKHLVAKHLNAIFGSEATWKVKWDVDIIVKYQNPTM